MPTGFEIAEIEDTDNSNALRRHEMASKHDQTARRLARREGVDYNQGQGADIISNRRAIEVETASTARDGLRQLQGHRKPVYIAGADEEATKVALEAAEGTTVGVMDSDGNIVKSSSRKRS
ncbi:MAG: hypothetical protein OXG58_01015 [Gemmatimonadetes bacterium]|nr:hypothetical protein [Gemmatimonadota bacterium]MCY3943273.1 hypothetical protein [Gemmatimonadota bacterium]